METMSSALDSSRLERTNFNAWNAALLLSSAGEEMFSSFPLLCAVLSVFPFRNRTSHDLHFRRQLHHRASLPVFLRISPCWGGHFDPTQCQGFQQTHLKIGMVACRFQDKAVQQFHLRARTGFIAPPEYCEFWWTKALSGDRG